MININQTSEQTKILIPRSNINGDIEKNNYVTEDELQEQLKNINIPYLVIDHIKYDDGTWGYGIVGGDFNKVYDAIVNRKPQIMYVPDQQPRIFYIPTVFGYDISTKKIWVAVSHHNAVDLDFTYYTFEITENLVTQSRQKRNVQEKLVSGENIKTINGNDILGSGDIVIESGTDIPYLFIRNDGDIISGDFDAVYDAVKNDKPYLIYVYTFSNSGLYYSPAECVSLVNENDIQCTYDLTYVALNDETRLLYRVLTISKNGAAISMERERIIPTQFKTINGNDITGTGDIIIEGGNGNGNIVELTQSEYNSITPEPDTLYVISDAPAVDTSEFITESELNSKGYTTSNSFKTINNQSIVGSGNINIEAGGGTEILYLWKLNGTTTYGADHNASVRNTLLSLSSSEEYPIIVVKDYNNDTICNNVYANASSNYVEIQCCNSRIGGTPNDLTDERYELLPTGMFRYVKNDIVATQNYVDEQIGDINSVLENIIG